MLPGTYVGILIKAPKANNEQTLEKDQTYKYVPVHLDSFSFRTRTPEVYLLLVNLLLRWENLRRLLSRFVLFCHLSVILFSSLHI